MTIVRWSAIMLVGLMAAGLWPALDAQRAVAQAASYSLRFYGHGANDIDRVKIAIDNPARPADLGATDFTLEAWLKATPGENASTSAQCDANDGWIYGNIIFDRDIWGGGDYGDFGVSLSGGRLVFGVSRGDSGNAVCGQTNVADGAWHHVAVTRRASDGQLSLFVDGRLDAQGSGPTGDVSYRDGRGTDYGDDPFLVIGAEKHDAGPAYPSFSGWIDEVRLSNTLRYATAFTPLASPFAPDANTRALYHFDEGPAGACTGAVLDSSGASGGPSNGACRYGGASTAGPVYTVDSPFAAPASAGATTVGVGLTPTPFHTVPSSALSVTPTAVPGRLRPDLCLRVRIGRCAGLPVERPGQPGP